MDDVHRHRQLYWRWRCVNPSYRQTADRPYGPGRLKPRPGTPKQDVEEWKASPTPAIELVLVAFASLSSINVATKVHCIAGNCRDKCFSISCYIYSVSRY